MDTLAVLMAPFLPAPLHPAGTLPAGQARPVPSQHIAGHRALQQERGQQPPQASTVLKDLRGALEHLDNAKFSGGYAVPGAAKKGSPEYNRALRALPGSRLFIAAGGYAMFGLIDPQELERQALATVRAVEEDLEDAAADQYFSLSRE